MCSHVFVMVSASHECFFLKKLCDYSWREYGLRDKQFLSHHQNVKLLSAFVIVIIIIWPFVDLKCVLLAHSKNSFFCCFMEWWSRKKITMILWEGKDSGWNESVFYTYISYDHIHVCLAWTILFFQQFIAWIFTSE